MEIVKSMSGKHWALLGGFLAAIAIQMSGIQEWHEVTRPTFVAGVLAQLGTFLGALYADKPDRSASRLGSVSPRTGTGTGAGVVILAAAIGLSSNCATTSQMQKASVASQTLHRAIMTAYQVERALCQPAPAQLNHCTAVPAILTDDQHQRFASALLKAVEADQRFARAILAWQPGTAVPRDLDELRSYVDQALAIATALAPSGPASELVARVRDIVAAITQAAAAWGGAPALLSDSREGGDGGCTRQSVREWYSSTRMAFVEPLLSRKSGRPWVARPLMA